jgi:cysteine synthase
MKKVFVIGAGTGLDAIGKAKKVLELKGDVEIICVESVNDVLFKERLKSDPSIIQQIHELKALPNFEMPFIETNKKRKGHERPYKFHR